MLQIGAWKLETVSGGHFWLDAGVMYGVVPKTVWQTVTPPDAQNRIPFAIHCVLARNGNRTVLVDTGHGDKLSRLDRSAHAIDDTPSLLAGLSAMGVAATDITDVVFTHLHWDHAGGATRYDESRQLVSTFPNASYFINRMEWEDALSGAPELAGSYALDNLAAPQRAGQVVLVDDEMEIVPGLWTRVTGGHTRGHQALLFESHGQAAIYPGDLCPVTTHLRRLWCAAYDLYPLETRRRKPQLLGEVVDNGWWMLWDHDPAMAASRLERDARREFVVTEPRAVL